MLVLVPVLVSVPYAIESFMWCQCQWHHKTKKVMLPFNSIVNIWNAMVPLIIYWHHVMPVLAPIVLHNQKFHAGPHFNHLALRNAMVPLMMPWTSCTADAKGITWPKSHAASQFDYLVLRNGMVQSMMPSVSYDASGNGVTWPCCTSFQLTWPKKWNWWHLIHHVTPSMCQWHHMTKRLSYISFLIYWPKKSNDAINDAISIMWCQHTATNGVTWQNIMFPIISIIVT